MYFAQDPAIDFGQGSATMAEIFAIVKLDRKLRIHLQWLANDSELLYARLFNVPC